MARCLTPESWGAVGIAALIAYGGVALMLYRFRTGNANMHSVWICSRNDTMGIAAVLLAAMGVFGTGTDWPDVLVVAIMGGLGLWGGCQIVSQEARRKLRSERAMPVGAASKQSSNRRSPAAC
jgi:Co/Zn/Cd efflux system component